jgi:hypothetical protein
MTNKLAKQVLATAIMAAVGASASAAPIFWTDWTGSNSANAGFQGQGTITTNTATINVTYRNPIGVGFYQTAGGTDFWANRFGAPGPSPYTSAVVDNRPTGTDIIALRYQGTQTLTFSEAIANPVFAFASLNGNGYAFDRDFDLLSLGGEGGNNCGYWGCGGATKVVVDMGGGVFQYRLNSNNVGGTEPHGALQFRGAFSSVTWMSTSDEYWNGFTVGVQGTAREVGIPEPASLSLFGLGLAALLGNRRRKLRSMCA